MKYAARTKLLGVAGAVAVGIAIGPAAAQPAGGPIDPGVYTADVVHPMAPFRTPNIDPTTVVLENLAALLDPLTPADVLEVRQRCSVIVEDAARYGEPAIAFCTATFAWVAENRPDAPDTDEALWALAP